MDWIVGGLAATTRDVRSLRPTAAVRCAKVRLCRAAAQRRHVRRCPCLGAPHWGPSPYGADGTGLISAKLVASVKTLGNQGS